MSWAYTGSASGSCAQGAHAGKARPRTELGSRTGLFREGVDPIRIQPTSDDDAFSSDGTDPTQRKNIARVRTFRSLNRSQLGFASGGGDFPAMVRWSVRVFFLLWDSHLLPFLSYYIVSRAVRCFGCLRMRAVMLVHAIVCCVGLAWPDTTVFGASCRDGPTRLLRHLKHRSASARPRTGSWACCSRRRRERDGR